MITNLLVLYFPNHEFKTHVSEYLLGSRIHFKVTSYEYFLNHIFVDEFTKTRHPTFLKNIIIIHDGLDLSFILQLIKDLTIAAT